MAPPTNRPAAVASPRPKNTLFCPECGHESPADGDWRVRTAASDTELACPVCGAAVTRRPGEPQPAAALPTSTPTWPSPSRPQ
jgi:predicted RNA-binding Zn-ribbon protein involved in translation (DUF1610 family)